nr:hypothetical protein [Verrucomicrobiota bacterium JB025]
MRIILIVFIFESLALITCRVVSIRAQGSTSSLPDIVGHLQPAHHSHACSGGVSAASEHPGSP